MFSVLHLLNFSIFYLLSPTGFWQIRTHRPFWAKVTFLLGKHVSGRTKSGAACWISKSQKNRPTLLQLHTHVCHSCADMPWTHSMGLSFNAFYNCVLNFKVTFSWDLLTRFPSPFVNPFTTVLRFGSISPIRVILKSCALVGNVSCATASGKVRRIDNVELFNRLSFYEILENCFSLVIQSLAEVYSIEENTLGTIPVSCPI